MNIQVLTDPIKRSIINADIAFYELDDFKSAMLASSAASGDKDCIYVVSCSAFNKILRDTDSSIRATFFVAEADENTDIQTRKNQNIIYVKLSQENLLNILNRRIQLINMFKLQCADDFSRNDTVANIIIHMARDLNSHAFFLDEKFRILCESNYLQTPSEITKAFASKGVFDVPNRIITALNHQEDDKELISYSISSSQTAFIQKIDCSIGTYIAIVAPKNAGRIKIETFIDIAYGYIFRLNQKVGEKPAGKSIELARFLDYCSGHQNPNPKEIGIYLSNLEKPIRNFYSVFIIYPDALTPLMQKKNAYECVCKYFSEHNVALYNGLIVVLYTSNQMFFAGDIICDELDSLMTEIGSYIIVNNALSNWTMAYTNFSMAFNAMEIFNAMNPDETSRPKHININEVLPYIGVDILKKYFIANGGNDYSYIYLTTPALIEIIKHDTEKNDNLLDVLYHYLLSGRNISTTSEITFMHRNTIRYKLKQIQKLCPVDIEDPKATFSLLNSYVILNYMKNVDKKPLPATISANNDNFSILPTGLLDLSRLH